MFSLIGRNIFPKDMRAEIEKRGSMGDLEESLKEKGTIKHHMYMYRYLTVNRCARIILFKRVKFARLLLIL